MFKADRLKKLRKEAGLIQADVAAQINLKRESYTRYETGDIQPPSDQVARLAKIFDTTSDYLLGLTDDPKSPDKKEKAPPVETEGEKIKEPAYEIGSLEWFHEGLIAHGIIKPGEDLSDEQLQIALANVETIVKIMKK